jgi:hypothetical protein
MIAGLDLAVGLGDLIIILGCPIALAATALSQRLSACRKLWHVLAGLLLRADSRHKEQEASNQNTGRLKLAWE